MGAFINWFIDRLASEDVVDLHFVLSDLVDLDISESERLETAYFDSLACVVDEDRPSTDIPTGKIVV